MRNSDLNHERNRSIDVVNDDDDDDDVVNDDDSKVKLRYRATSKAASGAKTVEHSKA